MSGASTPNFLRMEGAATPSLAHMENPIGGAPPPPDGMLIKKQKTSLKPYVLAMIAFGSSGRNFQRRASVHHTRRLSQLVAKKGWFAPPLNTIHGGISAVFSLSNDAVLALAIRDSTYLLDFSVHDFKADLAHLDNQVISDFIVEELRRYEEEHMEKFLGVGLPKELAVKCPDLCSRLWSELDIVPLILHVSHGDHNGHKEIEPHDLWESKSVDEQADSMARKCVRYFGPSQSPLLQVSYRGVVQVDAGYHAYLCTLKDYRKTCSIGTWNSVMQYAQDLKERKVKIAFFSATPQGGGVALMRHALVRFSRVLGTDITWYVPKPKPGVFRITKNNHNILQGVATAGERLGPAEQRVITDWIRDNAERYWMAEGGPLAPPSNGGADVIIIDDPQMPGLIPLIKSITPDRPVIYRSHIQVRSDLANTTGTPQHEAWQYFWKDIKQSDLFISHPVKAFVPACVPKETVGWLPAATDWLDGLNKDMSDFDVNYYASIFNTVCMQNGMTRLEYPASEYIIQIARFDPSKGILDVLKSYAKFYNRLTKEHPDDHPPQLLICGHGSIDDPDGALVYDQVIDYIETALPYLDKQICAMRVPPSDQILDALLSKSKIALQLSTREGFEIKVSEALHKGKPIIATKAGGIPLQVQDKKNGFLVDVGDTDAVAEHLYQLWTDHALYDKMSKYAAKSVSDECGTVGNTLSWLYLASVLSKGKVLKPNERWINDMAREEAGEPYRLHENKLKRGTDGEDKSIPFEARHSNGELE